MEYNYYEAYEKIVQGYRSLDYEYKSPEEQGRSIKKCSILESTPIEYSNKTTLYPMKSESE